MFQLQIHAVNQFGKAKKVSISRFFQRFEILVEKLDPNPAASVAFEFNFHTDCSILRSYDSFVYYSSFSLSFSPDADRWSGKLRSWEASGSHGLLANGEQRSPVEDGEDLHVPRPAETSAILHFRVRGPIPHGSHTQGHLQS